MGYTTDFVGHVDVTPSLNAAEQTYLTAFSASRRFTRPGGPYDVPGNPQAEAVEGSTAAGIDDYNTPPDGQPGLWCDWVPCWDGCCLAFNGHEKFYSPVRWLEYLIDHFLRPGAHASASNEPALRDFTFDHRCDGLVVACRRDNKELYAIRVVNNDVSEEILRPADSRYLDLPPLPYEEYADREREWLADAKPVQPIGGTVWSATDVIDARRP